MSSYHRFLFVYDAKRDGVWREICRFLQKHYISPQAKILEIGAGYCHFINHIQGLEKHALDIFPEIEKYATQEVKISMGSCTSMENYRDDSFDVVFASNLFEHLSREDFLKTLDEIKRVLVAGGRLIVIQPNFTHCYREYFDDPTHLQIFTHVGLSDCLTSSGFRLMDVRPRFLPFSMKSKLPKIPILVRWYLNSPLKPFAGQMLLVAEKRD